MPSADLSRRVEKRYVHHVPKVDAAAKGSAFIAAQMESVPAVQLAA